MKRDRWMLGACLACAIVGSGRCADDTQLTDDQLSRAAVEYARKLDEASSALQALRARIVEERAPLADVVRAREAELRSLEAGVAHLEALTARAEGDRTLVQGEIDLALRNIGFINAQAREGLAGARDGLRPGENQALGERIAALEFGLERDSADADAGLDAAEVILAIVRRSIGGHVAPGEALRQGDNRVTRGRFAFFGPEVYFLPQGGAGAGVVRAREGVPLPVVYPIPGWDAAGAAAFFDGRAGTIPTDGSGGKALRFLEAKGTLWDHIAKGGAVGYVIIALGGLGVIIAGLKVVDLVRMSIDGPGAVQRVLANVGAARPAEAQKSIEGLGRPVRELFQAGLRHLDRPKDVIEEHLYAHILQQRLRQERRLPLLAVIVTAAPLLGLLGTVTGMVKTFTLITIYGTGNAARLSSGISEALVTTELGLIVAIPILVVHGYLAHRMRKNIALLERYSYEFITAADEARAADVGAAARAP